MDLSFKFIHKTIFINCTLKQNIITYSLLSYYVRDLYLDLKIHSFVLVFQNQICTFAFKNKKLLEGNSKQNASILSPSIVDWKMETNHIAP